MVVRAGRQDSGFGDLSTRGRVVSLSPSDFPLFVLVSDISVLPIFRNVPLPTVSRPASLIQSISCPRPSLNPSRRGVSSPSQMTLGDTCTGSELLLSG